MLLLTNKGVSLRQLLLRNSRYPLHICINGSSSCWTLDPSPCTQTAAAVCSNPKTAAWCPQTPSPDAFHPD
jgi:hypothetical protein